MGSEKAVTTYTLIICISVDGKIVIILAHITGKLHAL